MVIKKTPLVTSLLCVLISGVALAAGGDMGAGTQPLTDGSESYPWLIEDLADFDTFADPNNAATYWANGVHTQLMTNIDLAGRTYTTAVIAPDIDSTANWFQGIPFSGVFDGNKHIIFNLSIDAHTYVGLFGEISASGQIRNLGVENVNITCFGRAGGLVGHLSGLLINCYATGVVNGIDDEVGGLVGVNTSTLISCYASCSVNGDDDIGGLVGENYGTGTLSCYATGSVNGAARIGGLIGMNFAELSCCYATGTVTGNSYIGGLVGKNYDDLNSCFATGIVTGSSYVGGFIGENYSGTTTACFWDIQTSNTNDGVGNVNPDPAGVMGKTTSEMKTLSTFTNAGWDFDYPWIDGDAQDWILLIEEVDYPKLRFQITSVYSGGDGTATDSYQIANANDFKMLSNTPLDWDRSFILTSDIDLSETSFITAPIAPDNDTETGFQGTTFTGLFDGNGFTIINLNIDAAGMENDYLGLFGTIGGFAEINDMTVSDCNIMGGNGSEYLGGLAGKNEGIISTCSVIGSVNGTNYVGGLVGYNVNDSMITSCSATSNVDGDENVGGLVGYNYGTLTFCDAMGEVGGAGNYVGGLVGQNRNSITSCFATATVTGTGRVGGLVGSNTSILSSCYATGIVEGNYYVGGLVGYNNFGTLTFCFSTGSASGIDYAIGGLVGRNGTDSLVTSCYATGSVNGTQKIGGLVGDNVGIISFCYAAGTVTGTSYIGGLVGYDIVRVSSSAASSFWDIETSGFLGSTGGKGLTTSKMKSMAVYQNADWEGKGWVLNEGLEYPRLNWENTQGDEIPSAVIPFEGAGTEAEPYLISTAQEFALLSWYSGILNKNIKLIADLDLTGLTIYPIGDLGLFTGSFDGDGHTISNIVIQQPNSDYVGLFKVITSGGLLKNLCLDNIEISGRDYVGGLVGYNGEGSPLTSCAVKGRVTGGSYYVGGLVGYNDKNSPLISCYTISEVNGSFCVGGLVGYDYYSELSTCYATGSVTGIDDYVGGLVGYTQYGTIKSCYAMNEISGSSNIGGLVGYNTSYLSSCYSTGSVTGTGDYVGGLVGDNRSSTIYCFASGSVFSSGSYVGGLNGSGSGMLRQSYATGSVNGNNQVGGLVGENRSAFMVSCYSTGPVSGNNQVGGLVGENRTQIEILSCYATGKVSGNSYVGGLIGENYSGSIITCFWDIQTTELSDGVGNIDPDPSGAMGKTSAEMKTLSTFTNADWDFDYPWIDGDAQDWLLLTEGIDYPKLRWQESSVYSNGEGTVERPYEITDINDFKMLSNTPLDWDKHFILISNIDLSDLSLMAAPIAPDTDADNTEYFFQGERFMGVFNGNGFSFENLTIDTMEADRGYLGLFGSIGGFSEINDITVSDCNIIGGSGSEYVGGLAGENNGTIRACSATGSVYGNSSVGGLTGENNGTISACSATGSVNGNSPVGGLVGKNEGILTFCSATTYVIGVTQVGGLVGHDSEMVAYCYADGSCTGTGNYVGGLVGQNVHATVSLCYSTVSVTGASHIGGLVGYTYNSRIDSCYSAGIVSGDNYARGLIGYNNGINPSTVISSFWDVEASGIGNPGDNNYGATGKTTDELQTQSTFVDWDFVGETTNGTEDMWSICEGTNYPRQTWQIPVGDYLCPDGVAFEDYAFFAQHWLETDYGIVEGAELTNDGFVGIDDLLALADYWLLSGCGDCDGRDLTGEGNINLSDLGYMSQRWNKSEYGDCGGAELTGDGIVDIDDFILFCENWLR